MSVHTLTNVATILAVLMSACGALLMLCGAGDFAKARDHGEPVRSHVLLGATGALMHVTFMVAALACGGAL